MKRATEPLAGQVHPLSGQIFADQIDLLFQSTRSAQIATLLCSILTVVLLWGLVAPPLILGWLSGMLLIAALRLLLARRYRLDAHAADEPGPWSQLFILGAVASGLLWGVAGMTIILRGGLNQHVIGAFILGGMATGAISTNAPLRGAYYGFVLPMLPPFLLAIFLCGDRTHLVMGLLGLVFVSVLITVFQLVHLSLRRSLALRYENASILTELATANDQFSELEERNRLLLESVGDGVFGLSLELQGRCGFCNPTAARLLGYRDAGDLIGKDLHELIHHHGADASGIPPEQCHIQRTLQTGEAMRVTDDFFWRADGACFPVEYHACPIHRDGQLVGVVVTFQDVSLQRQSQAELARRDAILQAMTFSAGHLLAATSSEDMIPPVLEHLGQAMQVCRVYIFERHLAPDGRLLISQRHEWTAPGISPQIANPELQNLPFAEGGFGTWVPILEQGEIVTGATWAFPHDVRAHLEAQEIRALLLVPIFSEQKWWGFIGFDSCRSERSWSRQEIEALKLAAGLFGAAIKRRKTDMELRQAAIVFANTHEGVAITDADARIVAVNTAFSEMTGYPKERLLGENPRILKSGRQDEMFYREMWDSLARTGHWQGEIWNRRLNGEIFPAWLTINAVRDAKGNISHYVSLHSDISVIKRSQADMEHLAHHDPLTQLPNRLLCLARMSRALERARRSVVGCAVLYLDLDRFKEINDTLGHPVGDELLLEVAQRLRQIVRKQDTVARLGGDEFAMVLEDLIHPVDAGLIAQKVLERFNEPFHLAGLQVTVTTSIGISRYPGDAETVEALLKHADTAMYQAKHEGRNSYRYYTTPASP